MIKITGGYASDVPAIMPIMQSAFDPEFGEAWNAGQCISLLAMPGSNLWVASRCSIISGFALTRGTADEDELLMIGVAPDLQGQSIGSELLSQIISSAQNAEKRKLFLEVRAENPARNFYRNRGFEEIGKRTGYYSGKNGLRHDAITMCRNIG
jgi:[ribosomal protein S18]-alanine N-acetyltransferase